MTLRIVSSNPFDDPAYWRERAKEALAISEKMISDEAKDAMREVVRIYVAIADRAARRKR